MEIILKEDIKGLGYKHDVVTVKSGYGRNYLIPQGHAIIASKSNKVMVEEILRQAAHKEAKVKADAEEIASKLNGQVIELSAKFGESGKIFGAITTLQVSDALKEKGIAVERKKINFRDPIKEAGEHIADIDLHKEVKAEVKLNIVPE